MLIKATLAVADVVLFPATILLGMTEGLGYPGGGKLVTPEGTLEDWGCRSFSEERVPLILYF